MVLALLVSLALAAMPADLVGRWTLDTSASQSVDALMAAAGASFLERQAAANMSLTQDIRVQGQELVIVVDSTFTDRTERLPLDGSVQRRTTKDGEPLANRTYVDGDRVVTVSEITKTDGVAVMEIHRRVEQGGALMRQTLRYTPPGGQTLTADRVFRREGGP